MNDTCVSIIIPVYNCEEYLERCIESVLNQSYHALEVLLIDDGSTDRSGIICDMYSEKDKRIKVFHISNGGVSNARNTGLQNAEGDYIQFVDSDDSIEGNMTESLVRAMEDSDADMVVCGYVRITKYIKRKDKIWDRPGVYSNKGYLIRTLQDPTGYYYGMIGNKMYRRDLIIYNKIHFDKMLNLGEDFVFTLEYLRHAKAIRTIGNRLYIYNYVNVGSLSRYNKNTLDIYKVQLKSRKNIFENYKNVFTDLNIYKEYEKQIYNYWKSFYFSNLHELNHELQDFSDSDKREWKEIISTDQNIVKCIANITKQERILLTLKIRFNSLLGKLKKPTKSIITILKKRNGNKERTLPRS